MVFLAEKSWLCSLFVLYCPLIWSDESSQSSFPQYQMPGSQLVGRNFEGANLTLANLSGANASEAKFANAQLDYANLSLTNFSRADLSNVSLKMALIEFTDFSNAIGLSVEQLHQACLTELALDKLPAKVDWKLDAYKRPDACQLWEHVPRG